MFSKLKEKGFNVLTLHHSEAILTHDMKIAVEELEEVLLGFTLPVEELVVGGGGEALGTQRLRNELNDRGWRKCNIFSKHSIQIGADAEEKVVSAQSHEIDHVKSFGDAMYTFAMEIEWNNKDPFYDRDLENFKRLHADGAISVGGIITRGDTLHNALKGLLFDYANASELQSVEELAHLGYAPTPRQRKLIDLAVQRGSSFRQAWADKFCSDKFGESTTHWRKLMDRVERGVGNPCPLVLIGLPDTVVLPYSAATEL